VYVCLCMCVCVGVGVCLFVGCQDMRVSCWLCVCLSVGFPGEGPNEEIPQVSAVPTALAVATEEQATEANDQQETEVADQVRQNQMWEHMQQEVCIVPGWTPAQGAGCSRSMFVCTFHRLVRLPCMYVVCCVLVCLLVCVFFCFLVCLFVCSFVRLVVPLFLGRSAGVMCASDVVCWFPRWGSWCGLQ
jgi:hypothetical protein